MKKTTKFFVKNWKKLLILFIMIIGVIIFFSSRSKNLNVKVDTIKKGNVKEKIEKYWFANNKQYC